MTHNIKRLIIHIGRHKSGSSSLAAFFNENTKALDEMGILYPGWGRIPVLRKGEIKYNSFSHKKMAWVFNRKLSPKEEFEKLCSEFGHEIHDNHHTVLISSEAFQNVSKPERVKAFCDLFPNAEISVICYFREHVDYKIAMFRQFAQNRQVFRNFSEFADTTKWSIKGFWRKWGRVGSFKPKWFYREGLKNGDVIDDFCNLCEIYGDFKRPGNRNPSLGGNLLFLKLAANKTGTKFLTYPDMGNLMRLNPDFTTPFYLSNERAEKLRLKNQYNQILIERIGEVPFKSWTEHPPLPDIGKLQEDISFVQSHYDICKVKKLLALTDEARYWF